MLMERSGNPSVMTWLFLSVLATLAGIVALATAVPRLHDVKTDISHGVDKHGVGALETRQCLDSNGPSLVMRNFQTNRWAEVCDLGGGKFGVRIAEEINGEFQEITAFSDFWEGLWEVEKYLWRQGYAFVAGIH